MSDTRSVDLRGLKCPTPIVRLNEELRNMVDDEELIAVASDRAFELDVKSWCRRTGHELRSLEANANEITICVRKRAT